MAIVDNDGYIWVIADSALLEMGKNFKLGKKVRKLSSNDVQIFSHFFILFHLFDHTVVGQRDRSISCKTTTPNILGWLSVGKPYPHRWSGRALIHRIEQCHRQN